MTQEAKVGGVKISIAVTAVRTHCGVTVSKVPHGGPGYKEARGCTVVNCVVHRVLCVVRGVRTRCPRVPVGFYGTVLVSDTVLCEACPVSK